MLVGGPGIGKTTLVGGRDRGGAGARAARAGRRGRAAPRRAVVRGADRPASTGSSRGALAGLPAPQRAALEVALLRAEPTAVPPEPHAIALGLLERLRALAAREPVLVAIDDVQWLDRPSADALAFVARRLERERVGLPARQASRSPAPRSSGRSSAREFERLEVGPLSLGATRRLLSERLGLSLSRQLLRRIVESTLGNPLFALELGRTLVERGLPEIGEEIPVPDAVEEHARHARGGRCRRRQRRLLLAVALSARPAHGRAGGDRRRRAVSRTPSMPGCCASTATACARRTRCWPPPQGSARGRGSGASCTSRWRGWSPTRSCARCTWRSRPCVPTRELAATVAAAAGGASARGRAAAGRAARRARAAPDAAGVGGAHRARCSRSPAICETAGELQRLTDLLDARARRRCLRARRAPARGCFCLRAAASAEPGRPRAPPRRALAECERRPGLRAYVLAKKAANTLRAPSSSRIARRRRGRWKRCRPRAQRGSRRRAPSALPLAWARALSGRPIDDLCERFGAASDDAFYIAGSPERVAGQRLVWRGELSQARADADGVAGARRRARRADVVRAAAAAPVRARAARRRRGTQPRASSTSGPSPPIASCCSARCTSAAARCSPRAAGLPERGRAVGGEGDREPRERPASAGTSSRRCARRGIAALLAHRARACRREPARGVGAHRHARGSTSPACSRSRPSSSRRSPSSANSTRRSR